MIGTEGMKRPNGPQATPYASTRPGEPSAARWRCRVFDHRIRFRATGDTMSWSCEWCGGASGSKTYRSAQDAERFARGFDRRDGDETGRRAPYLGMFPLRLWRFLRDRQERAA